MKKKYLIDIYHIPQYNFFKNAIKALGPEKVDLCCVNRSKLVDIIKYECPDYNLVVYGDYKYNNGRFSLIVKVILPRIFKLLIYIKKNRYKVIGTASYQSNLVSRIKGIPNFSIFDDPRKGILQLLQIVTNECYLPQFTKKYNKIKNFNALKEWAYLSPKYFEPSEGILNEFKLKKKEYIFIREVSTKTLNYLSQEEGLILKLSKSIAPKTKVILSLENKAVKDKYPKNWLILKEPVSDIYSLMYYSKLVLSTGDSVAREGAMLGVPSVYLGNREMPANEVLIEKKLLFKLDTKEALKIINNTKISFDQDSIRAQLEKEWDDVTQLIISLFKKLEK